ncbi:MAG: hypothetical protein ACPF9D_08605 [Owenweeksia sp.]
MLKKIIIAGCLCTASFFLACKQQPASAEDEPAKELEMYQESELAALMRNMYTDNMELREQILNGSIPENFPEHFYTIHTAKISDGMSRNKGPFKALADQYLKSMEAITSAASTQEARLAYNNMIMSCTSCHQVYCPGPLSKIRKMKISPDETTGYNNP